MGTLSVFGENMPTILSSVIQRHRVSNQKLHLNLDSEDTNQPKDPRPCDLLLPPSS